VLICVHPQRLTEVAAASWLKAELRMLVAWLFRPAS